MLLFMEFFGLVAFVGLMLLLAAIPSGSVGFVVVSSVSRGLPCGVAAALGIVAGDLIFVGLALLGMTALAESMGALFAVLRYAGGAYLIWMGIGLVRSAWRPVAPVRSGSRLRVLGAFHAGLLLTLGDLKAIFFYASLFPVFIDLATIKAGDMIAILILTAVSVGAVKIAYAVGANRIAAYFTQSRLHKGSRLLAGGAMIGAGGILFSKS